MKAAWIPLIALAALFASDTAAQAVVEKPVLGLGDRWVYRSVDGLRKQETETSEDRVSARTGDDIEITSTILTSRQARQAGQVRTRRVDGGTWTFENASIRTGKVVALSFPLEVGKTWSYEYTYKANPDSPDQTVWRVKATVEKWEEIRVPAGTFRALKVVHKAGWTRSGATTGQGVFQSFSGLAWDTVWYAPEAKRWVKRIWDDRDSLGSRNSLVILELLEMKLEN